ncbi:hypothetical protein B5F25_08030 [Bacteroides sp. An19]|nr:hypothetical protein B5F25_08030 [Bacteroides sp. An19]
MLAFDPGPRKAWREKIPQRSEDDFFPPTSPKGAALPGQSGKRLFLPQEMRMTFDMMLFIGRSFTKALKIQDVCYAKIFPTGENERLELFQPVTIEKNVIVCSRIHRLGKPDIHFRIDAAIIPNNDTDCIIRFTAVIPDEHFETVLHLLLNQSLAFT